MTIVIPTKSGRKAAVTDDPAVLVAMAADYRAGVLSTRDIGFKHGVSHVTVQKMARVHGWERDLRARIAAKADAIVSKQAATAAATKLDGGSGKPTEQQVVDANGQLVAEIKIRHRGHLGRLDALVLNLIEELERTTKEAAGLAGVAERLASQDTVAEGLAQLRAALERSRGYDKRLLQVRHLMDTMERLMRAERVAYDIAKDPGGGGDGSMEDVLRAVLDEHG